MNIPVKELRQKVLKKLEENFGAEDASRIADYLLWADMSGIPTQGVIKMVGGNPLQDIKPKHEIRVKKDTQLSQLIDAGAAPAPLVTQIGTDRVIEKAEKSGFGLVGINNTFSSNGALAFYAERIACRDLIGIVMARSPKSTTAFDSIDQLFGTNPVAFSFPTANDPLVFDMATSAMTFFGLVLAKAQGKPIPENMAIDKNGKPTTDPLEAMDGALLPFDRGYKGSGLGMVVEMMAGVLTGATFITEPAPENDWGTVLMALSPDLLVDVEEFKANAAEFVNRVKSSRKKPGAAEIRLPGERACLAYKKAEKSGMVDVDEAVLKELGYA